LRLTLVFALILVFAAVIVAALVYSHVAASKLRSADWQSLVASIEPVQSQALEAVALDHLQPQAHQLRLEPYELWDLVGGIHGLKRMRRNADRMIALAAYVQRWNFEEAIVVAERIRHDSILLKRALFRIQVELYIRRRPIRAPFHIHQAASSYYLMSKRLLALYETSQFVLYPRLAEAL
jgi:hypothetical protein